MLNCIKEFKKTYICDGKQTAINKYKRCNLKNVIFIGLFIMSLTEMFAQQPLDSISIEKGKGLHASYQSIKD